MKKIIAAFAIVISLIAAPLNAMAIPASNDSNQAIQLIQPGEGETFRVGGDSIAFKTLSEDISGELSVIEITAAPQSGPALHKHPPEIFYIVNGEFEFYGDGAEDTIRATAGDFVHIPSGAPHAYKNIGTTPGKYFLITAMAGNPEQLWFQKFEYEMSKKLGTPVNDGKTVQAASQANSSKSLNNKDMVDIARKYSIEFLQ
ncbi:MAG: cupin domain-containing protein [Gloeocapsa sp. UFS-A4-WI-NPMV-4B04]|jgi:quercetin dioxygenase-like cupin family protein|nr:cupin domain-containing protein [Gloeocapsa sp. UFS-A4-WI-NPMV-4B04]